MLVIPHRHAHSVKMAGLQRVRLLGNGVQTNVSTMESVSGT